MSQVTKKDILPYIIGAVGLGFGIVMAVKASKPEKEELGAVIKADCKSDWNKVDKNAKNRVERKAFVSVLLAKHKDKINESSKGHYVAHLNKCFDAGLSLMLPADKNDLGFHCFAYADIMAGEFYFAKAKMAADKSCGCNTPVSDVIQLCE